MQFSSALMFRAQRLVSTASDARRQLLDAKFLLAVSGRELLANAATQ